MKNNHIFQLLLLCVTVAELIVPYTALADNIDYGSLQSLFGEPVTTSATGIPQRASNVPADMTIISADEIRQSGTRSIPQIIGLYVPGVDVLRSTSNSYDIGIRGYQQPFQSTLLVLVDGRQVFVDDYSRTIWDNLPVNIDDVRQIEVVKGASSSLFGSNAATGVINIITYSPLYDNNNVANLTVGTQRNVSADGTVTIKGKGWGSKTTVGGLSADEFNSPRAEGDANLDNPKHHYLTNDSIIQINPSLQVTTGIAYSQNRGNTADQSDNFPIGDQKTERYSAKAGFDLQSDYGNISYNNYLDYNNSSIDEPTDVGPDPTGGSPYHLKTTTFTSGLQDRFRIGSDHTIRLGLGYKYESFAYGYDAQLSGPIDPLLRENNISVDGTWLWKINDNLALTNAVRLDNQNIYEAGTVWPYAIFNKSDFSQTKNAWSVNSDLNYKIGENDSVRGGYGRGIQLPSALQLGGNIIDNFGSSTNLDEEGNPYLKPTVYQNYDMGYSHTIPKINSELKTSLFYTEVREIVVPYLDQSTVVTDGVNTYDAYYSNNVGGSHSIGGEISLKGKNQDGYRWNASYSLVNVHDDATIQINNGYDGSSPEHHVRLLLGYTTGQWEFDGNGQYLSSTNMMRSLDGGIDSEHTHVNGYYSFGGRVGYKLNDKFTVALTGTNISAAYTKQNPYLEVQRQVFLSLTGHF